MEFLNSFKDTPKAAERGTRFGLAMIGWGAAIEASAVVTGISPLSINPLLLLTLYTYSIGRVPLARIGSWSFCL